MPGNVKTNKKRSGPKSKAKVQKSNDVIPANDLKLQNKLIQQIEKGRNELCSDFINDYL